MPGFFYMKGRVLTMDLEKIFTRMAQGPEKINNNFDLVKQVLATAAK